MNSFKRAIYGSFVLSIKAYQRLFMDFQVWGRENIPPGAKIIVGNHITSHDPFYAMPVFGEPMHYVIGPGYRSPLVKWLLDFFEQINALDGDSDSVVNDAVKYLAKGEPVCIGPEGNIQEPFQLGRFYPGVARIYRNHPAPLIPVAAVAPKRCMKEYPKRRTVIGDQVFPFIVVGRGTYCLNFGEPWMPNCPKGSDARKILYITRGLRERIEQLVEDVRQSRFWQ